MRLSWSRRAIFGPEIRLQPSAPTLLPIRRGAMQTGAALQSGRPHLGADAVRLLEHQAKALFAEAGLPTPRGGVAREPSEAADLAAAFGPRIVVKAQVRAGGRGKAGGILM